MADVIETIKGRIIDYDERTQELVIRARYDDLPTMVRREYDEVSIRLHDSRPLSNRQRRCCYAMLRDIGAWSGYDTNEIKEIMKLEFWTRELWETADSLFSLRDAPMSVVAAFQTWLIRFIVSNDIPTKVPIIDYVDDIEAYIYACIAGKKCCVCGKRADLHHIDRVGMGRNRDDIIHEGMRVLPLCREHHNEAHTMPDGEFFEKYHLTDGVTADKTICKIYGLRRQHGKEEHKDKG